MKKLESNPHFNDYRPQRGSIKLAYLFPILILILASLPLMAKFGFLQFLSFFGIVAVVFLWARWNAKKENIPDAEEIARAPVVHYVATTVEENDDRVDLLINDSIFFTDSELNIGKWELKIGLIYEL